jgi:Fe-S-cluster containining protein
VNGGYRGAIEPGGERLGGRGATECSGSVVRDRGYGENPAVDEPPTGCTGACCAAFPMGASNKNGSALGELGLLARLWVDPDITDGLDILAMIVPLTHEEAIERRARFGGNQLDVDPEAQYYRCVHWDEDTRLCRNYENRPGMCRDYPYGNGCDHGCDCEGARPRAVTSSASTSP